MPNLFDNLKTSSNLIIDAFALDFDYLPKLIQFREQEQKYLADCIKPLFNNSTGKNILVTGKPGIGKSAAVRFVLRELEEKGLNDKVIPIYVNCWKHNSEHKVLLEICNIIDYKFTHNKTTTELIQIIAKIINQKAAVICLDEIDKLENNSILYNLIEDIYKKTIILITNQENFLTTLDKRIYSRLMPETINFKHYNYEETKEILLKRIDLAFNKNVIEQEAFEEIAAKSSFNKDIRVGLTLLKDSANISSLSNQHRITKEHALEAINRLFPEEIKHLDMEEQIIGLLKENKELSANDIFNKIDEKDIGPRQLARVLTKLKEKDIISTKTVFKGRGGNIPLYSLKQTTL